MHTYNRVTPKYTLAVPHENWIGKDSSIETSNLS